VRLLVGKPATLNFTLHIQGTQEIIESAARHH
jgi:hypothetical protein